MANLRYYVGVCLNGRSLTTAICHLDVNWETSEYKLEAFPTWAVLLGLQNVIPRETQNMKRLFENLKISLVSSVPFWCLTQRYRSPCQTVLVELSCLFLLPVFGQSIYRWGGTNNEIQNLLLSLLSDRITISRPVKLLIKYIIGNLTVIIFQIYGSVKWDPVSSLFARPHNTRSACSWSGRKWLSVLGTAGAIDV